MDPDNSQSGSNSDTNAAARRFSDRAKSALKSAGRSLSESGERETSDARSEMASRIGSVQYKRGGKVRHTGLAKLHKGERVIPAGKRKKVERMMRKEGMRFKAGR